MAEQTEAEKVETVGSIDADSIVELLNLGVAVVEAITKLSDKLDELMDDESVVRVIERVRNAGRQVVAKTSDAVRPAASRMSEGVERIAQGLANAKSEKELRRAIRDARQLLLENAHGSLPVSKLLRSSAKDPVASVGRINDMPGCFVIATYRKIDVDKDLTDYTGIFVGKASDVAAGVSKAISRNGDPDVYADVKYKQNVHVYIYNCADERVDERYAALLQVFSDERLYGSEV